MRNRKNVQKQKAFFFLKKNQRQNTILISFLLINLLFSLTNQTEYLSNVSRCSMQENNKVVPLNNGKFAIHYVCSNVKASGSKGICVDVKTEDSYTNSFSGLLTPDDSNIHDYADSSSLSNGNIAFVYAESNSGLIYFFIADGNLTKVFSDRRVTDVDNNAQTQPKIRAIVNNKFVIAWGHNLYDGSGLGIVEFIIEVTDKSGKTYSKTYLYEKGRAPYGGSCVVSPSMGTSMITNYKFTISDWITNSEPMIYQIKYLNKDNVYIDISKGGFPDSTWSTNLIPVAKEFALEVIDSSGLSSRFPCSMKVKPNHDLLQLDSYLEAEFDPNNRLLLVEIYKSNKENLESVEDPNLNNRALDMIDYYMQNAGNIDQDLENIIARIMSISNQPFDKDKFIILNKSIKQIIDNIDPLLQYIDKMQNVYRILDNIFKKASSMDELKKDKDLLDILQNYLNELNTKLFTNIIKGQGLLVTNESYDTKMNKVSKLNIPTLAIDYDSADSLLNKNKKSKVRYLENSNKQADCSDSVAAICISPANITSIMNDIGSNGVGFQGQLNHKDNLPIAQKQFSNSIDFGLSTEEKVGKLRSLNSENLNINFEIRLKMPVLNDTSVVQEATCVQYSGKKADTSCDSWYDTITNEVVCSCIKQGLTVNVMDKYLSSMSKLKQFPTLSADLFNPYSIGIVSAFIIVFSVVLTIGMHKDRTDHKSLIQMTSSNYDFIQYYIVRFRNEGFEEQIKFTRLYCYLLKNLHPILSILNIYDPIYNRKVRTMDFFLNIYLTFFFTLLPFYMTDNSQLIELAANRSVQNRNKTINNLDVALKQVFQSIFYSVMASITTILITTLIGLFLYEDILLKESQNRRKMMFSALMKVNGDLKPKYKIKIEIGFFRIKTILIIIQRYLMKLRGISPNLNMKNNESSSARSDKDLKQTEKVSIFDMSITDHKNTRRVVIPSDEENIGDFNQMEISQIDFELFKENKVENIRDLDEKREENRKESRNFSNDSLSESKQVNIKVNLDHNFNKYQSKLNHKNPNLINDEKATSNAYIGQDNLNSPNKAIYTQEIKNKLDQVNKPDLSIKVKILNKIQKIFNNKNITKYEKDNMQRTNICNDKSDYSSIHLLSSNRKPQQNTKSNINSFKNLSTKHENKNSDLKAIQGMDNYLGYFGNYNNDLFIAKEIEVCLKGKKEKIENAKNFIVNISARSYIFPCKDSSKFSCQRITITEASVFSNIVNLIKSYTKIMIIGTLYVFLWIYIAVFVESIYKQYGKNIFKICVMPLISMLFIKLLIVVNIMLLIATIILYFKGKAYLNNAKNNLLMTIIFKALVPPLSLNHFSAIISYQNFCQLNRKSNKKI